MYQSIHNMSNPIPVRTTIPDESTTVTSLEIMGRTKAIIWLIILGGFLFFCCVLSFSVRNTMNFSHSSPLTGIENDKFTLNVDWQHFSPLSSFFILWLEPLPGVSKLENTELLYQGEIRFLDEQYQVIRKITFNETRYLTCTNSKCPEIELYKTPMVDFNFVSAAFFLQTPEPVLHGFQLTPLSLNTPISLLAFILITIVTVLVILSLCLCIPCRMKPNRQDHWVILFLALSLLLIDGPWLVLKYYTSSIFTQVFDIGPELFHILFILATTFIIAAKTADMPHRVFSSLIIRCSICAGLIILMVLQFCITKLMPLHTLSIFKNQSYLTIPSICLFIIFHLGILLLLIYGILSLQIQNIFVLILTTFSILLLELIQITITIIRFSIPRESIGSSFAGEIFYILMANIITLFLLLTGLPVGFASDYQSQNIIYEVDEDD